MTYLRVHQSRNTRADKRATMIRARTAFYHSSSRVWRRRPFCCFRCSGRFSLQITTLSRSNQSHSFGFLPGEWFRSLSRESVQRLMAIIGGSASECSAVITTFFRTKQTSMIRRQWTNYNGRDADAANVNYTDKHTLLLTAYLVPTFSFHLRIVFISTF